MNFKKGEITNESYKVIMRDIELLKSYRKDKEDFDYYYNLVVGNIKDVWGEKININLYVCEILEEFDYFKVGDIRKFLFYDYKCIEKRHPNKIKFLRGEVFK